MIGDPRGTAKFFIGIISPVGHGSHEELILGYLKYLHEKLPEAAIYPYYVRSMMHNNITLCVRQVLDEEFDLIVSVGVGCSEEVHKQLSERSKKPLWIICGYKDAQKNGLFSPFGPNYSIFFDESGTEQTFSNFMYECVQNLKSILIPIRVPPESDASDIANPRRTYVRIRTDTYKNVFAQKNVTVDTFSDNTNIPDLLEKVKNSISNYDLLFFPEGIADFNLAHSVAPLCLKYKRPLSVGAFSFGASGEAALGNGTDYKDIGIAAAEKTIYLFSLENIYTPENIPLPSKRGVFANLSTAAQQGLDAAHVQEVCQKFSAVIYR